MFDNVKPDLRVPITIHTLYERVHSIFTTHYQKFAKYQRIYRRNICVGNLRSKLSTDNVPSVLQSVTTDENFPSVINNWITNRKVSIVKKRRVADVEILAGYFFRQDHRRIQKDSSYSDHHLYCRQNHRRNHQWIWNGRSVWWRVDYSVRIIDGVTDGVSIDETIGKS